MPRDRIDVRTANRMAEDLWIHNDTIDVPDFININNNTTNITHDNIQENETRAAGVRNREFRFTRTPIQQTIEKRCRMCGCRTRKIKNIIPYDTDGLDNQEKENIKTSIVRECPNCKKDGNPRGWIYRYFSDTDIKIFSIIENRWKDIREHSIARLPHVNLGRDDTFTYNRELTKIAMPYDTVKDKLNLITFTLNVKTEEINSAKKTSLIKNIEALMPILNDDEIDILLNNVENNEDAINE